jgi:hypothetical protein
MSWDVAIVKINGPFRPIEEVDDADYLPLGSVQAVIDAIGAAFPKAEWSDDQTQAIYDGGEYSIEFALQSIEEANTVVLNVRGSGDPIPQILNLTKANGWTAVDCATSEFIDPANPSYEGWEGYKGMTDV